MPELATIPAGTDQGGLPPLNLPSLDVPQPRPRLRVTVGAKPQLQAPEDPYAGFTEYKGGSEGEAKAPEGDPYAGFTEYTGESTGKKPFSWTEALGNTLPGRLAKAAYGAATLPGDVWSGKVDPLSEEAIGRSADLATFANPVTVARGTTAAIARAGGAGRGEGGIAETLFGTGKAAEAPVLTSGQRAAQTSAELGAPLPRGFASDRPGVQSITARTAGMPIIGSILGNPAARTVKAAGGKIQDIISELTPAAERATTDAKVRPALEDAISASRVRADQAYDALREEINPDQIQPMPALRNAIGTLKLQRERSGARGNAVSAGLDELETLAREGGGFNGAHLRRQKLDEGAQYGATQPSLSAKENRFLRGAISQDLKNIVRRSTSDPNKGESLFNTAEITYAQHAKDKKILEQLLKAKGEGTIGQLLSAGKEKGGNARLLAQLRRDMDPEAFSQIAGTALHELGAKGSGPASQEGFSLAQFSSRWKDMSSEAKNVLFSPQHQKWIDDVASLGAHLKDPDKYANKSNTAGAGILFLVVSEGMQVMTNIALGAFKASDLAYPVAVGLGGYALARFLASPAKAAAMSAWVKAYRAANLGAPTPARLGVFVAANRNLAHNLGLDPNAVMRIVQQGTTPAPAQTQPKP